MQYDIGENSIIPYLGGNGTQYMQASLDAGMNGHLSVMDELVEVIARNIRRK